ncbi:MAG TPA: rRNA maturation RNase YbeY [Candidatus Omnitrophota bacterium]|nr:rRNA maturation RNase YbeY [Candidatus Omnitrophota bacterium]
MRMDRGVRGISAEWVRKVVRTALSRERTKRRRVSVLLTNDAQIRRINKAALQHDYATDVISFGCEDEKLVGRESDYLGDLVVSVETARNVAKEIGIAFREELARYLVHGTLHLLGYDDKSPGLRAVMYKRQEAALESYFGRQMKRGKIDAAKDLS